MNYVGLFLMSKKGLNVLNGIISNRLASTIDFVVYGQDKSVENDYSNEIVGICKNFGIPCTERKSYEIKKANRAKFLIAVSWRWLIPKVENTTLIVLHDSLLPKYRGFAPLVSALVNGEHEVGVTALYANSEYDTGDIIGQASFEVSYPIKIIDAIDAISNCYVELIISVLNKIKKGIVLPRTRQNEMEATYSLWRDDEDYIIDWSKNANRIKRFVDATGYPYKGSLSRYSNKDIRVTNVQVLSDVNIENRTPGKVIFMKEGKPIVVCGEGLIQILEAHYDLTSESIFPLKKFRIRFK